jgi:hypothetical protein
MRKLQAQCSTNLCCGAMLIGTTRIEPHHALSMRLSGQKCSEKLMDTAQILF